MNIDWIILHSTQDNLREAAGLKNIPSHVEPEGSYRAENNIQYTVDVCSLYVMFLFSASKSLPSARRLRMSWFCVSPCECIGVSGGNHYVYVWSVGTTYPTYSSDISSLMSMPLPVSARAKRWIYGRSFAGIAGSDLAKNMNVFLLWRFCVVR
jgi:hypothetical protein